MNADGDRAVSDVLDFWFEGLDETGPAPQPLLARWFGKTDANDQEIARRFAGLVEQALRGGLEPWAATPRGRLALVILLDQFTRNLFRGSPRAFSGDARALALCREAIGRGDDQALDPYQRVFLYLPLEHAEDMALQRESVRVFEALAVEAPDGVEKDFDGFLDYARRHAVIIERFGRFPHRNQVLDRRSSPDETAFLREPGSSF